MTKLFVGQPWLHWVNFGVDPHPLWKKVTFWIFWRGRCPNVLTSSWLKMEGKSQFQLSEVLLCGWSFLLTFIDWSSTLLLFQPHFQNKVNVGPHLIQKFWTFSETIKETLLCCRSEMQKRTNVRTIFIFEKSYLRVKSLQNFTLLCQEVRNIAILRFLVEFFSTLWKIMLLFRIFWHYLLSFGPFTLFCCNLRTFLGKIISARTLLL